MLRVSRLRPVSGLEMSGMLLRAPAAVIDPHLYAFRPRSEAWPTRSVLPLAAAALLVGLVAGAGVGVWRQSAGSAMSGIVLAGRTSLRSRTGRMRAAARWVEVLTEGIRQPVVDVDADGEAGPRWTAARGVADPHRWAVARERRVPRRPRAASTCRGDRPRAVLARRRLAEADDGDPGHSGNSIVRGELRSI